MKTFIAASGLILETCVAAAGFFEAWPNGLPAVRSDGSGGISPAIAITRYGDQIEISFTGGLQSADSIMGPWMDVEDASSPYSTSVVGDRKFYRAVESRSIFSSRSVVSLTLTGPFQFHFDAAFAGEPDGIFPPVRLKPYFDGMLQMAGVEVPVSLRVRGNSSLQECPFPKLKFKVSRKDREGTPFFDAREIKIGTHCAEGGQGTIGRLRDERAAFREALAYEVIEIVGFVGPRVRRARIEYRDTSPAEVRSAQNWPVTRNAVILDDVEVVGERLGGRALEDEEVEALKDANFDEQLVTDLQLLQALLGNWDYELSQDGRGLWNIEVIELEDGTLVPIAGDFDLASWVTEVVRLSAPADYHPELPDVERQVRYEVEEIRKRVSPESFAAGIERFQNARAAIEARILAAEIDEAGRSNALRHTTAFFDSVAETKGGF